MRMIASLHHYRVPMYLPMDSSTSRLWRTPQADTCTAGRTGDAFLLLILWAGQLDRTQCEQRLVVDITACIYPVSILEATNGFFGSWPMDPVNAARIKTFSAQFLLDLPNIALREIGHCVHIQLSEILWPLLT